MTAAAPLVSCLMVTRGNLFPARFSIEGYRRQDWPDRELVIVSDAPARALRAHIEALDDPTIRFVDTPTVPLGELRNVSVAEARGDYCTQWDDDDLFAPGRISVQMEALVAQSVEAIFLERWTMWWPDRLRLAVSQRRWWEGSMLARTAALPPYAPLARLEDTDMAKRLTASAPCGLIDRPDLYCYVIHGQNTWDIAHFNGMFGRATQRWEFADYEPALKSRAGIFPFADYAAGLEG